MIKKIFFVLVPYIFIISCSNNNYNDKIKFIDSLDTKIDTITKQIVNYNNVNFSDRYNLMFGKIKIFGEYINNENLNTPAIKSFGQYANLSKFYKHIGGKKDKLFKQLALSKQQLQNLKHDLQNNLINTDSVDNYFNIEKNIANDLFNEANLLFTEIKKSNELFNNLSPKIDLLIDSLKNTKNINKR